jgi:hypothetical protein
MSQRTQGSVEGIRNTYTTGLISQGGRGLAIMQRSYFDQLPGPSGGPGHDHVEDLVIRGRLIRENASADNQIIWVNAVAVAETPNPCFHCLADGRSWSSAPCLSLQITDFDHIQRAVIDGVPQDT